VNCGEAGRVLQAYLDGDLAEREVAGLEAHLAECAGCREELSSYTGLVRLLEVEPLKEPPCDFVPLVSSKLPAMHPDAEHLSVCRFARFAASITGWISPTLANWSSSAAATTCRVVTCALMRSTETLSDIGGAIQNLLDRFLSLLDFWRRPGSS